MRGSLNKKKSRLPGSCAKPWIGIFLRNRHYFERVASVVDTVTKERRSRIMGRVRSKDTRPEMVVRRLVHGLGYRFRLHRSDLPGKPDLVFPKYGAVILVHGCYWHRHPGCPNTRTPKSRIQFWTEKFDENVRRDKRTKRKLRKAGWRVLVVWECEVADADQLTARIQEFLEGTQDAIN